MVKPRVQPIIFPTSQSLVPAQVGPYITLDLVLRIRIRCIHIRVRIQAYGIGEPRFGADGRVLLLKSDIFDLEMQFYSFLRLLSS